MTDTFVVDCPYCGELVEIYLEPDVHGRLIQDCEVCCRPWLLHVMVDGNERTLDVSRADGTD